MAFLIDFIVVGAILKNSDVVTYSASKAKHSPIDLVFGGLHVGVSGLQFSGESLLTLLGFILYSAILVGFTGQTLGMMVLELRVVTTDYRRPGIAQSVWRYAGALLSMMSAIALVGFFMRIHPHDYVSRTRLIRGRGALEGVGEPLPLRPG
jgi:uncharacterized RDD family membrane protein YckC